MEVMFPVPGKKVKFGKFLNLVLTLLLSLNVVNGYWRSQGEKNTKLMLQARSARDWNMMWYQSQKVHKWYKFDANSVPLDYYRGLAKYHLKEREEAQHFFLKAHDLSPYNFHVLNNLATIELDKKNYDQALTWLGKALEIHPQFEDALYNLAYAKAQQGHYQEALKALSAIRASEKKRSFESEIRRLEAESLSEK